MISVVPSNHKVTWHFTLTETILVNNSIEKLALEMEIILDTCEKMEITVI